MPDETDGEANFNAWLESGEVADDADESIWDKFDDAGQLGLLGAFLDPEDVVRVAAGPISAPAVADLLGFGEEEPAEEEPPEEDSTLSSWSKPSDPLSSLIDMATEAISDAGSRISDAADDFGKRDYDGDSVSNAEEFRIGTDPTEWDTDGDKIDDGTELHDKTDPRVRDTDKDGRNDWQERKDGTDPKDDSKFNESSPDERLSGPFFAVEDRVTEILSDVAAFVDDVDGDGLTNDEEIALKTSPWLSDSDDDGLDDGDEVVFYKTNPTDSDSDGDFVHDGDEVRLGSDPGTKDTDGDGDPDLVEYVRGTLGPAADDDLVEGSVRQNWVETERSDSVTDDSLAFDMTRGGVGGPVVPLTDLAREAVTDLGAAARDGVVDTAKGLAAHADDLVGNVVTGFQEAKSRQAERSQAGDGVATPEPKPAATPEVEAIVGSPLEGDPPALTPIPEAPEPLEVETEDPVVAVVVVEEPQIEMSEPETFDEQIGDIGERTDSLKFDSDDLAD